MANKDLLKIGRLTQVTGTFTMFPGGTDDNNFIRFTATYQSGNNTVTVTSENASYRSSAFIRKGMILRKTGLGFTDNLTTITSDINTGTNQFTIADAPDANLSTGTTVVRLNKGRSFIDSGSFVRPNNYPNWNLTEVTGSSDSEYSAGDRKWAILTEMALTSSETSAVSSVYGVYEITEVTNRGSNTLASMFITSSAKHPEPVAFTPFKTGTSVGITELTLTSSVPQLFHGGDIDVVEGLGFAGAQDQVLEFLDKSNSFPFSGSAQITGSLGVTGSAEIFKGQGNTDFFLIKSASFSSLKFNNKGVAVFGGFSTLPTAIEGGFAYSASNFYAGVQ